MNLPWLADQGDGTYRNPVLNADWSDPDVIRVGDDFYLTASSFSRVPGLPLLHSRDLVNWTLIGHALDALEPAGTFAVPRHDCGVWAPALRWHDDRFWIFWGDPDMGIYQVNAPDIRGPWSAPHLLKAGKGLIDPCPLWDEEGRAYLVHAWAKSRSGVKNRLTGHRMSPDGREVLDSGTLIIDGDQLPGWFTLEGPKAYQRDGWYWILAPAGSVETGWQGAFRARDFFGPYEERVVLAQGTTEVNGPHQGAWVTTPGGEDWFLHFQDRQAYGRVVHLQPMRWDEDGWPVLGEAGEPVARHPKPALPPQPVTAPATDDDFPGGRFGRQWSWTANPPQGLTTTHSADGLRLTCHRTADAHDLRKLPNVLAQRMPAEEFTVEVDLTLESQEPGAKAGLAVLGDAFSWIGLERGTGPQDGVRLVHRFAGERVAEYERDAEHPRAAPSGRARLRVVVSPGARCRFFAAVLPDADEPEEPGPDAGGSHAGGPDAGGSHADGPRADGPGSGGSERGGWAEADPQRGGLHRSGQVFAATSWNWVGAHLGLFATAPQGQGAAGTAVFERFRVTP